MLVPACGVTVSIRTVATARRIPCFMQSNEDVDPRPRAVLDLRDAEDHSWHEIGEPADTAGATAFHSICGGWDRLGAAVPVVDEPGEGDTVS